MFFSSAQAAPDGSQLLREMAAAEAKIEFSATQIVQRASGREVARIFRDGRKRRLEWVEPAFKKGDVLVDDGQNVWIYHRADNSAVQTKAGAAWNFGGSGASSVESGQVAGRAAWGIGLPRNRKIWVDAQNKALLRFETRGQVTALQNVQFGPVGAAKFAFSPPPGATVTRLQGTFYGYLGAARRASSWLKAPQNLPPGYNFESAIVDPQGEIWLRYSNGVRRFSLFQQRAEGGDVTPQKVAGGWFWKSGGTRFLATGAPDEAIGNISSSLQ